MGPGFSALLGILCMVPWLLGHQPHQFLIVLGLITAALNLFNLLPAEPLDGGIAMRSVLTRIMGTKAQYGLFAMGVAIMLVGIYADQIVFLLFGGLATFVNLKPRKIDVGQTPLSSLQVSISALGYAAIGVSHITLLSFFFDQLALVNRLNS
jgi:Zn-dependent protease